MKSVVKEVCLYGLEQHLSVIDRIICDLEIEPFAFDVKLILVEAVMNAFTHGNQSDCTKPIHIRYSITGGCLKVQVEDCGTGFEHESIPEEIDDEDLLQETGRGLFLIRCFSDRMQIIRNIIHIEKKLTCQ